MSDSPPPLRPKPGSLRDRIAAFEQKPPSSPTPPLAPRPKPGNLSQWKPHAHTPHDAQPANNRNDPNTSMSASDAKESITKAGSLKERMAALQGLGAFGGVPTATAAAALPSKPSERPKWKPPPQVAVAPPVTGNEDEEDSERADSNKSAVSPLRAHADAISETLLTPPTPAVEPAQEVPSQTEIEPHVGEEEVPDPEEEQRQRRAAIAARMARLGGTRVGMGPPIFGRKPEIKPKPPVSLPETNEDVSVSATPLAAEVASRPERDIEHAQTEIEIAANVPIPISPHTVDKATEEPSLISSLEYFPQQAPASASPNIPSRAMPVPQGPRRPAPPRKKSSQKPTPPAELEAATSPSLDKDEFSHTSTDAIPECQSPPSPVPGHVALQVSATDTISDVSPPEPADGHLGPTKQSFSVDALPVLSPEAGSVPAPPLRPASPSLDLRPEYPSHEPEIDSKRTPDLHDIAESSVHSTPSKPHINREEAEDIVVPDPGESETPGAVAEEDKDEIARRQRIAERVAKIGGFNPFGGQLPSSPPHEEESPYVERKASTDDIPIEGTTLDSQPATPALLSIPHSELQHGGGEIAFDEEDDGNDESDPRAQASLQPALGDVMSGEELGDVIDDDDAHARVVHEGAAEARQHSESDGGERATMAAIPSGALQGQYATSDFGATRGYTRDDPLAPELSVDDISDNEMAPPRVTRPLPPAPAPAVNPDQAAPVAPTPPVIPKRTSLPAPTRAVPVPSSDTPPPIQGPSPQRAPARRTSLLPPSREIPIPVPDILDVASPRHQSSTKRTSLPPPTLLAPSSSFSREGSFLPPPPPPPPALGYSEFEPRVPGQNKEAPQGQDETVTPIPPAISPVRKASIAPPVPDGRRSVESRRSIDKRSSREERRASGQYAVLSTPATPVPISPPPRKRVPPSLLLEQELLHEDVGDPIDPQFHAPSKSPSIVAIPRSPPPTSGTDPISSIPPGTRTDLPSEGESDGNKELKRRRTIAERMAKLGGIKFGAPPPVNRVQPSAGAPARPPEDLAAEESAIGLEQPAEAEEDEQDEQARRQRIAAKLAGMGGMRLGMLPIQPGVLSPPPPPIPVRREEESTPRSPPRAIAPPRQPATHYSESDQEYEHPSSSDDGVQVEAEESELEEVLHEDLEDEYVVETVVEGKLGAPPPPPPPPRSTRPPVPSARPPVPPTGRNPSIETPPVGARSGSFDTITSVPRAPAHQATSDFVMVEAEEAHFAPTAWPSRGPPPTLWTVPPPLESSDLGATGHWELPSIPSGSLDLGDSGLASDLSGSMWSEDSTAYPPAAQPSAASSSPPPTGAPPSLMGQSRAHAGVPARMTADDLRAVWNRVGAHVAEAAAGLLERSKRTLVGNGSYEGFIAEALAQVPNASLPHSPGEYGILIYAQTGAQVHTRLTDIMAGDVVVLEGAKLKGHKGLQSYSMSAGEGTPCMGVVSEFDAKKLKLKALQANQRVGQVTVESVSYRLEDLKSGTIKVYRVGEA